MDRLRSGQWLCTTLVVCGRYWQQTLLALIPASRMTSPRNTDFRGRELDKDATQSPENGSGLGGKS